MCGIAGIFGESTQATLEKVTAMTSLLAHRGPDDVGFYRDRDICLGHRRLSVIDLSQNAHQPMSSADGRFTIVYNGEIYNYMELRDELKKQFNIRFRSNSDVEVLLYALTMWGDKAFEKLNGMWAFALWDKKTGELMLSRDRFGIKPLYYARFGEGLVFASEIKAILRLPEIEFSENDRTVINFLYERRHDHTEETFFKGIYQIPPAAFIMFKKDPHVLEARRARYWSFPDQRNLRRCGPEEFLSVFKDAVKLCLRSDVPLACLLSGGMDSTSVASMMAEEGGGKPIDVYSSVHHDGIDKEYPYIKALLDRYKSSLRPHFIKPNADGLIGDIEELLYKQEEPISDGSTYSFYCLVKQVHADGIKVVLAGEGGDEILAGYIVPFSYAAAGDYIRKGNFKMARLLRERYSLSGHRIAFHMFPAGVKNMLCKRALFRRFGNIADKALLRKIDDRYILEASPSMLNRYLMRDLKEGFLRSFLHLEDRNAMAFSIEARYPFLDHRLVSLMLGSDIETKINENGTKSVLRKAMAPYLPDTIIKRHSKKGMYFPMDRWLTQLEERFRYYTEEGGGGMFPYLDRKELRRTWQLWEKEKDWETSLFLWRVTMLFLWMDIIRARINEAANGGAENAVTKEAVA